VGRDFKLYVEYRNVGLQDLVAPMLRLRVPASIASLGLSQEMEDASSELWMVAVNPEVPAGILPPGASGRVTVFGRSTAAGNVLYSLDLSVYEAQQIDWQALKSARASDTPENRGRRFREIQVSWEKLGGLRTGYFQKLQTSDRRGAPPSLYEIFQLVVDQARPPSRRFAFLFSRTGTISANGRLTLWDETDTMLTTVAQRRQLSFSGCLPGAYARLEAIARLPVTVTVGTGDVVSDFIASKQAYAITGRVFTLPDGMPVPDQLVAVVERAGAAYTGGA
jgi:hypothetical protein